MPKEEADGLMERCIKSGLWVPEGGADEVGPK